MDGIVCETPRLVLRRITMGDLEPLAAILGDPDVSRFIGGPRTVEQTRARMQALLRDYDRVGFSKWAIVSKNTGEVIGRCGPAIQVVEGVEEVEVGYDLARGQWGQGLATEAAAAAVKHALEALGLARLIALIHPQNVASQRVARNVGMTYERDVAWRDLTMGLHARAS